MTVQAMRKNVPGTVASMTDGEYELFSTHQKFDLRMNQFYESPAEPMSVMSVEHRAEKAAARLARLRALERFRKNRFWREQATGRRERRSNQWLLCVLCGEPDSRLGQTCQAKICVNTALLWLQTTCHLFTEVHLPIWRDLPSIQSESRPAGLVMVVTDF
jgi:hypothetical protein